MPTPHRSIARSTLAAAVVIALASPAAAQPAPSASTTLDDLKRLLDEQRALLARQGEELAAQRRDLDDLRRQLVETHTTAVAARSDAALVRQQTAVQATGRTPAAPAPAPPVQTPEADAAALEETFRRPELPLSEAALDSTDFSGFMTVPGTDAAFRLGGQARSSLVHSLGPLGDDDRFITSSIPVEDQRAGQDARTSYTAAPTRLNIDVRSPTRFGGLRTFIESDFAGEGEDLARLRHAFIQFKSFLFGQTWSTFSDPEAEPADIDFEGLNAISLFRQAQLRYTRPFREHFEWALAIEDPAPDLAGASGVNLTPDFIARVRWQPAGQRERGLFSRVSHVQAAVLVRTLRGELADDPSTTLSTGGAGLNVSGVLTPPWDGDDRIKFATNNGWGIGRYIKDLEALGGQDAVYDASTNELRALPVASAYFGYERQWRPTLFSAFTYGVVNVSNLDIQPDDALRRTQRASASVTWNPIARAELVFEFLTGRRVNKDGRRGTSSQLQAGWKFRF